MINNQRASSGSCGLRDRGENEGRTSRAENRRHEGQRTFFHAPRRREDGDKVDLQRGGCMESVNFGKKWMRMREEAMIREHCKGKEGVS